MSEKREATLFDCSNDQETLQHFDPADAIAAYLDDYWERGMTVAAFREALPESLTVYGFAPMVVTASDVSSLDDVLEHLDEEFGNPDGGEYTKPTDAMKAAHDTFCKAIAAEYSPWMCEKVSEEKVDTLAWVKENEPDWLVEKPEAAK